MLEHENIYRITISDKGSYLEALPFADEDEGNVMYGSSPVIPGTSIWCDFDTSRYYVPDPDGLPPNELLELLRDRILSDFEHGEYVVENWKTKDMGFDIGDIITWYMQEVYLGAEEEDQWSDEDELEEGGQSDDRSPFGRLSKDRSLERRPFLTRSTGL